jgi:hypothetical protein
MGAKGGEGVGDNRRRRLQTPGGVGRWRLLGPCIAAFSLTFISAPRPEG